MDTDYLVIPKRINVGFQERYDTYTQKLAYVIYYDDKGVLRKEKSWQSWRNKKIPNQEFDNVPTSGFVLNKKAGGYKSGWDFRQSYIRVYDPRDFEFEITVENLLMILENCVCTPGKGLEGEFVYSWSGTELVLLPVKSPDYQKAKQYNKKLETVGSFTVKDLKAGHTYVTKKDEELIFLGKYDWYDEKCQWDSFNKELKKGIRYLFAEPRSEYRSKDGEFRFCCKAMAQSTVKNNIIGLVSEEVPDVFDEMLERVQHSEHISPIDYKNIELLDMTFEQFAKMVYDGQKIFFYDNGVLKYTSRFEDINNNTFYRRELNEFAIKCYCKTYSKDENINACVLNKNILEKNIFKSFQVFYDDMKPKIGILHLENGNVYKNFFTGICENFYIS